MEPPILVSEVVAVEKDVDPFLSISKVVPVEKKVEHFIPIWEVVVVEKEVESSIPVSKTISLKRAFKLRGSRSPPTIPISREVVDPTVEGPLLREGVALETEAAVPSDSPEMIRTAMAEELKCRLLIYPQS